MQTQHDRLAEDMKAWKGDGEQIDDILVMGISF
jgi:hypothetical protein